MQRSRQFRKAECLQAEICRYWSGCRFLYGEHREGKQRWYLTLRNEYAAIDVALGSLTDLQFENVVSRMVMFAAVAGQLEGLVFSAENSSDKMLDLAEEF